MENFLLYGVLIGFCIMFHIQAKINADQKEINKLTAEALRSVVDFLSFKNEKPKK